MTGLTDAQAGKIAEHLKLDKDGPSYEAVSQNQLTTAQRGCLTIRVAHSYIAIVWGLEAVCQTYLATVQHGYISTWLQFGIIDNYLATVRAT